MIPQTSGQLFKDWLATATVEEMEEELFTLEESNLSMLSQIEEYELKAKTISPTAANESWRLRIGHAQRWTYFQMKAIERQLRTARARLETETKAANQRMNMEAARLKHETSASRDRAWVKAAGEVLDRITYQRITALADAAKEVGKRS